MKENDKKMDDVDKAKEIMGKIDPELLSAAINDMVVKEEEAEEADVEKVKEHLKKIHDMLPADKDKMSIIAKAFEELNADVAEKEASLVREKLASFSKETIIEAAKEFIDIQAILCPWYRIYPCRWYRIRPCHWYYRIWPDCFWYYRIWPCKWYKIYSPCSFYNIYRDPCSLYDINYCKVQLGQDIPCKSIGIDIPEIPEWEINPAIKERLKAEIIQELLQSPELSRAMKKMLTKIKDEG